MKPCLGINEISSSFFFLLLEILFLEGPATLSVVRNHPLTSASLQKTKLGDRGFYSYVIGIFSRGALLQIILATRRHI